MIYIAIGLGGVVGALLRYYLGITISNNIFIYAFPLGTLFINCLGAFILSWLNVKFSKVFKISEIYRLAITTGLLGSFTTFSTFSTDTIILLNKGLIINAFLYVFLTLVIGLFMAYLGYSIANKTIKKRVV